MKHLHLKSPNFRYIEQSFKEWLDVLGYAERTVNGFPLQARELFHYLEQKQLKEITQVKPRHVISFIQYLQSRINLKLGGSLSASSINSYITSLTALSQYLNQTGRHVLDVDARRLKSEAEERVILSTKEIKALYEATFEPHRQNSLAIGQRDRAIIAIFYGCGLRKDEGSRLDLSDVDLNKGLVFVKKAKGNKQRYVPIAQKHLDDLRSYIEEGRYWFLQDNRTWYNRKGLKKQKADQEAFFLNMKGKRMKAFYARLADLRNKAGIESHFSTHNLRHSIATHLLQSGMMLEEIARFLGHASLESTQIYTHIINQLTHENEEL
jgi:site-specific recombinase XerD